MKKDNSIVSISDIESYNEKIKDYWAGLKIRQALIERDGNKCVWCGVELFVSGTAEQIKKYRQSGMKPGTIEHLVPRWMRGGCGGTRLLNLKLSCKECNNKRGGSVCKPMF